MFGAGRSSRYVRGWLGWDLVTSLPFDRILCFAAAGGQGYVRFVKLPRLIKARRPPPRPALRRLRGPRRPACGGSRDGGGPAAHLRSLRAASGPSAALRCSAGPATRASPGRSGTRRSLGRAPGSRTTSSFRGGSVGARVGAQRDSSRLLPSRPRGRSRAGAAHGP